MAFVRLWGAHCLDLDFDSQRIHTAQSPPQLWILLRIFIFSSRTCLGIEELEDTNDSIQMMMLKLCRDDKPIVLGCPYSLEHDEHSPTRQSWSKSNLPHPTKPLSSHVPRVLCRTARRPFRPGYLARPVHRSYPGWYRAPAYRCYTNVLYAGTRRAIELHMHLFSKRHVRS